MDQNTTSPHVSHVIRFFIMKYSKDTIIYHKWTMEVMAHIQLVMSLFIMTVCFVITQIFNSPVEAINKHDVIICRLLKIAPIDIYFVMSEAVVPCLITCLPTLNVFLGEITKLLCKFRCLKEYYEIFSSSHLNRLLA